MPNNNALFDLLVRKGPLDDNEWDVVIEHKRALVHKLLNKVTLTSFRDSAAGPANSGIYCDAQTVFDGMHLYNVEELNSLQGIFAPDFAEGATPHDVHFWCLARSGRFMVIDISFESIDDERCRAKRVTARSIATAFLLDLPWVDRKEIISTLSSQVMKWRRQKEESLRDVTNLEHQFEFDDGLLAEKLID